MGILRNGQIKGGRHKLQVPPLALLVEPGEAIIGRIVVCGKSKNPAICEAVIFNILKTIGRCGKHLKFLITPGGYIESLLPMPWRGSNGWESKGSDLEGLIKYAEIALNKILTKRVRNAAEGKVDVLTVGIDLMNAGSYAHAELVAIYESASKRIRWTGKSYPTQSQERHLIQVADLSTHFLNLANETVLVLGCHDLNMFSPRARANQKAGSVRRRRCNMMRNLTHKFNPTVVLHHPHNTVSPMTWNVGWVGVERELPNLKAWASGIAYLTGSELNTKELYRVLDRTHGHMPSVDFIVLDK